VSLDAEPHPHHVGRVRVVVCDQHACAGRRPVGIVDGRPRVVRDRWHAGQPDGESGSAVGSVATRFDRPAVQLDEALREREAHAKPPVRAVAVCLELREHVEDVRQLRGWNADAGVRHGHGRHGPWTDAAIRIWPEPGVNFAALFKRFENTCDSRVWSASAPVEQGVKYGLPDRHRVVTRMVDPAPGGPAPVGPPLDRRVCAA
jgi:hypothetical protein